ncbi:SdiA-regulated domain-containing protein [Chamaesiphon sp. VAR_48_metabat_403]|uniref:SdiA-regulated domain-containing protein n=1 Tax=Chamaesiphon sp. VAR_48_metabat_403 TaxID=2964700 RepID=UPI00286D746E|nr:SdiA-regulated domain-containing protein [Chamaesiphon sp. VAR_48_metabat_403]
MTIRITEYSYTAANGEFFELTNTGTTPIDLTGWSFDDNTRTTGSFSLTGLGILNAGASAIVTETAEATFRTAWNIPAMVKVLGGSTQGLGRADEINIYDAGGVQIDRLTYNDETIAGSPRTQNVSAWTEPANLGTNDTTKWKLSVVGDPQGSVTAAGGDIGSPGRYGTAITPAALTGIDLSTYTRVGRFDLPEPTRTAAPAGSLLAQEVSAVTYNVDTDTLFVVGDGSKSIVQVDKTGKLIDSMTLAAGSSPQGTEFYDLEGLTYIGGGKFVMVEERDRQAVSFTYVKDTALTRANTQTVKLGTTIGNEGIEGISYDPQTSGFVAVKELSPQGVFQTTINFAAGTASNGSPTTVNSTNLFDPALAGLSDLADVFALSNIKALDGKADAGNLLLLSQASGKIVEVDRSGKVLSSLTIATDAGNPLSVADQQHEGLTVDKNGNLYVVSENGGGSIDRPQLWVYAPSTGTPNPTPTPTPTPIPVPAPAPNPNLFISEVTPWASGNAPYAADWFEVTNKGTTAVDITGWKVDDNSNAFASAVALNGVTSIAPGQSVVFIEATDLTAAKTAFQTAWFGSTVPSGFTIGNYSGAGIGLSTSGDSVNLYNAAGSLVTGVSFGASPTASPFATFDNQAGLGGTTTLPTIATLSVAGTNGAILAADKIEIGSPGSIANLTKPTPTGMFKLQLLHFADQEAGIPALEDAPRLSAVLNALKNQDGNDAGTAPDFPNTLILSSGDAYIPGAFLNASEFAFGGQGRADILIQNELGVQAITFGNHEFDLGTTLVANLLKPGAAIAATGTLPAFPAYPGTLFPYLSGNLNFAPDANLAPLVTADGQEANKIAGKIAGTTFINVNGQKIGIVGATTPTLRNISSPGNVAVSPATFGGTPTAGELDALAAVIQADVDVLLAANPDMNKVIVMAHMQQISIETELAKRLKNVDIIMAGGSNTRLFDSNDVLRAGDTNQGQYPTFLTGADGKPVALINTDGNYKYVGRLVVDFDDNGNIVPSSYDATVSGAYATDAAGVATLNAQALVDPEIQAIVNKLKTVVAAQDGAIFGRTDVFLNGTRNDVRTQETNFGNISADANLAIAKALDPTVSISIKNGGGIRDNIGVVTFPTGGTNASDAIKSPPEANPLANKAAGDISQLDITNSLRFNNGLTLVTLTAAQLLATIEHSVAGTAPGATPGQFGQFGGIKFSFDATRPVGDRVLSLTVEPETPGGTQQVIAQNSEVVGNPDRTFRAITLNFLASGGDNYPFPAFQTANPTLFNRVDLLGEPDANNNGFEPIEDLNRNGKQDAALVEPTSFRKASFAAFGSEQDALAEYLVQSFPNATKPFKQADTAPALDERIQNLAARKDTVIAPPPVNPTSLVAGTAGVDNLIAGVTPGFDGINDIVFTGSGNDSVDIPIAGALAGNNRIDMGSGNDIIYLANNDRAFGSAGDDIFEAGDATGYRISAGAGNDTLYLGTNGRALGGDGNDKLFVGAGGGNFLSGGAGADQFWIANAEIPGAANTILDFQIGTDVIGIQGAKSLGISATSLKLTQVGADTTVNFGSQTLAVLTGIQASSLTPGNANQFVFA